MGDCETTMARKLASTRRKVLTGACDVRKKPKVRKTKKQRRNTNTKPSVKREKGFHKRQHSIKSRLFEDVGENDLLDMVEYIKGQIHMIRALERMNPNLGECLASNKYLLVEELLLCRCELDIIRQQKESEFRASKPKLRRKNKVKKKKKRKSPLSRRTKLMLSQRLGSLSIEFNDSE